MGKHVLPVMATRAAHCSKAYNLFIAGNKTFHFAQNITITLNKVLRVQYGFLCSFVGLCPSDVQIKIILYHMRLH